MKLYLVCSNGGPGIQNGNVVGGLGFKTEIYLNIFFSRTAWLRGLKIWYVALPVVLYQVCSNQGLRVQDGPTPGGPRFEP